MVRDTDRFFYRRLKCTLERGFEVLIEILVRESRGVTELHVFL